MQLNYRGSTYKLPTSEIQAMESSTQGQYRGVPVHFTSTRGVPLPQAGVKLTYRGSHYIGLR